MNVDQLSKMMIVEAEGWVLRNSGKICFIQRLHKETDHESIRLVQPASQQFRDA
jgi:hypothetical protein